MIPIEFDDRISGIERFSTAVLTSARRNDSIVVEKIKEAANRFGNVPQVQYMVNIDQLG